MLTNSVREKRGTHTALALLYETISLRQESRQQTAIVTRDVSKAFDKVWHTGLKYKITQLELPRCFTALLCDFLNDRTAQIQVNNFIGEEFPLRAGVAQGSVLSPTLYNLYTADAPTGQHAKNFLYADDLSQEISYAGASKQMMARRIVREVEKVNEYERQWKIKTNKDKFKILYVSKRNPPAIIIDNQRLMYSNAIKILGLKLNARGFTPHVIEKYNTAKAVFTKIKRFKTASSRTKLHLAKALILPHLCYPPSPLYAMKKTKTQKMQSLLNKTLRWINGDVPPYTTTIEDLHNKYKMTPLNVKIFHQNEKVWERIHQLYPAWYNELTNNRVGTHSWWPSSCITYNTPPPRPVYIEQRREARQPIDEAVD